MGDGLAAAQNALRLDDIYVRSLSSALSEDFVPSLELENGGTIRVQMRHGAKRHTVYELPGVDAPGGSKYVEFIVECGARFVSGGAVDVNLLNDVKEDQLVASITVEFGVLYRLVSDADQDCLEEFGRENAPFHVWPYWRELLQDAASRMKMPAPILPMYRRKVQSNPEQSPQRGDTAKEH